VKIAPRPNFGANWQWAASLGTHATTRRVHKTGHPRGCRPCVHTPFDAWVGFVPCVHVFCSMLQLFLAHAATIWGECCNFLWRVLQPFLAMLQLLWAHAATVLGAGVNVLRPMRVFAAGCGRASGVTTLHGATNCYHIARPGGPCFPAVAHSPLAGPHELQLKFAKLFFTNSFLKRFKNILRYILCADATNSVGMRIIGGRKRTFGNEVHVKCT